MKKEQIKNVKVPKLFPLLQTVTKTCPRKVQTSKNIPVNTRSLDKHWTEEMYLNCLFDFSLKCINKIHKHLSKGQIQTF